MGGVLAGSTALAGLGAGRSAAETDDGLRIDVRELTEEYVAVEVWYPTDRRRDGEFIQDVFLGDAARFVLHEEETVSLPEDTDGFATPVEARTVSGHEGHWILYFRTAEVDRSAADGEGVTLGLGVFPERTVPENDWAADPGPAFPL